MIAINVAAKIFCMVVAVAGYSIEASAADPAKEVAALHAVDQMWVRAYNAGDVDTVVKLYDEHAVLLPPGAPAANGRIAIRAFFAKDIAASAKDGLTFGLGPRPEGGVSGNMGWASGAYVVKDKLGRIVDAGKYLSVSTKKGGKWLYVRDTWNSDGPALVEGASPSKK